MRRLLIRASLGMLGILGNTGFAQSEDQPPRVDALDTRPKVKAQVKDESRPKRERVRDGEKERPLGDKVEGDRPDRPDRPDAPRRDRVDPGSDGQELPDNKERPPMRKRSSDQPDTRKLPDSVDDRPKRPVQGDKRREPGLSDKIEGPGRGPNTRRPAPLPEHLERDDMPPVGTRGGPPADRLPYSGGGPGGGRGGGGPNSRPIPGRIPADAGPAGMGGGAGMPGMGGGALGGGMEGGGLYTGGPATGEGGGGFGAAGSPGGMGPGAGGGLGGLPTGGGRGGMGMSMGGSGGMMMGGAPPHQPMLPPMMADDAELSNLAKRDHDLEQSCRRFADELRQKGKIAADDRSKLQKMVAEHFKVRQDRRLREINLLREQITKLEQQLDRRQQSAEDLTNRRTASLLGEDSGF